MPFDNAASVPSDAKLLSRRTRQWRSLFLSDLHLGTSRGQPGRVVDFLNHVEVETIYLVGDIFDGWHPRIRLSKPSADHRRLLTRLEAFAANGTRVVFVPGNHDASFRKLSGEAVGPMQVCEETHHKLADGRTMLVTHGDSVDPLMALGSTVSWVGGKTDVILRKASRGANRLRVRLGGESSDRVETMLTRINAMMHPRNTYATRLTTRARDLGFQGVICGHYHIPAMADFNGITYANCGDWLDHFSAVAETAEGRLELVSWPKPETESAADHHPLAEGGLPAA